MSCVGVSVEKHLHAPSDSDHGGCSNNHDQSGLEHHTPHEKEVIGAMEDITLILIGGVLDCKDFSESIFMFNWATCEDNKAYASTFNFFFVIVLEEL